MTQNQKKVYIKSYGCQMNVYDSDRMGDALLAKGYQKTENPDEANLIILNTCHIREKASEKVYSDLGRALVHRQNSFDIGKRVFIAVTGCVAQAEGREIIRRAPYVDIVLGPQTYHHLPEMLEKAANVVLENPKKGAGLVYTDFPLESKFDFLPEIYEVQGVAAFLSVQEGCDKMCTFCVVPYTRGAEYSRPINDILKEAERLITLGVKEITLLGQNVTAFHGMSPDGDSEWTLADLIERLSLYPEIDRIRYVTSHPRDMEQDIIDAHRHNKKLMPYLHLPVQSGSDRILKAMNRKYTSNDYLNLVQQFQDACPDIAFATDIIVGFPGETDEDFEDTMKLVEKVKFCTAYSFKYSPRPGTPASTLETQVPEDIKDQRLYRLQALLNQQQIDFNESIVGKTISVLFEKPGKHSGQIVGRSPYLQPIHVIGSKELIGQTKQVKITSREGFSMMGVLVDE
jgi:tRNA-2-methylthio-N6-dimethylallyladenosine synthase